MILLLLSLLACDPGPGTAGADDGATDDGGGDDGATDSPDPTAPDNGRDDDAEWDVGAAPAARSDLRIKRWRQLTLDLEGALEIQGDALCNEAGLYDCRELHAVPLGGISVPNGLYRPVDSVGATTGLAMERFVMQACWERAKRDAELAAAGEDPVVFPVLTDAAETALSDDALATQVAGLYRRLLARDPLPAETDALAQLHTSITGEGGANGDWAVMACFAVGTTTEALTY